MKIGLLSDTHGWLDSKILDFFKDCDEVWHCGDIGDLAVTDRLAANFNLRAVYGNIDGGEIRTMFAVSIKMAYVVFILNRGPSIRMANVIKTALIIKYDHWIGNPVA